MIYLDDILIYAETREELEKTTRDILQTLKDNDLYMKPEKCVFAQETLEYLGFIISQNKISMYPAKVKGML